MKAGLRLLDRAIPAPMMRDPLKKQALPGEPAEPLYRYYVFKSSPLDADRDKTDFLSTYLLRHPGPTAARRPRATGGHLGETYSYIYSQEQAQEFEKEIQQILATPASPLPTKHDHLLPDFQF